MSVKIIKKTLKNKYFQFNGFVFVPSNDPSSKPIRQEWAIFTHGYTASKSDCISWAQRLAESGIPAVIFDLPGHHLGSLNKVESFDDFKDHAVECFEDAYDFLQETIGGSPSKLILGGHSLGALLSVKALELDKFSNFEKICLAIGFGISQHSSSHIFESDFYKNTLNIRRQLVDETIDSDFMFAWINEEKHTLNVTGERIHMITGLDDVVVGKGGLEALSNHLKMNGNTVSEIEPKKLPHHEPSLASVHIYSFLKKELSL